MSGMQTSPIDRYAAVRRIQTPLGYSLGTRSIQAPAGYRHGEPSCSCSNPTAIESYAHLQPATRGVGINPPAPTDEPDKDEPDPCADGCPNPWAHAEGAHDV